MSMLEGPSSVQMERSVCFHCAELNSVHSLLISSLMWKLAVAFLDHVSLIVII